MSGRPCRKLCTSPLHKGPRWMLLLGFDVKTWGSTEPGKEWVAQYQSWCRTCYRVASRRRKAIREGRDPDQTRPQGWSLVTMTTAERKKVVAARKAAEFQRRMARIDPATGRTVREGVRALQREAAAARRRERGVPERRGAVLAAPTGRKGVGRSGAASVDFTPLWKWLGSSGLWEQDQQYLASRPRNGRHCEGIGAVSGGGASMMGSQAVVAPWDEEVRRRLREARIRGTISMEMVDRVLMAVGRPDVMAVLYGEV